MQLRHISPRSLEWTEALGDDGGDPPESLSPDETLRLGADEDLDRSRGLPSATLSGPPRLASP